ncbi:MAG: biopolymer transporter ExbD [Kiritimatiellia bacterium]|jgi:biopolymer transport protein ExbD|nr:biopolymer transporter ExbD [Kiritimatiellia bacterium]MDP6847867.1 biopolymer transporter ExbD [Kiritimatiellia bacterium]
MIRYKKKVSEYSAGCEIDMTPMIDVVFQLIIFFIVTINMEQNYKKEIVLEDAKNAPVIKNPHPMTLVIEVDKRGWISLHGAQVTTTQLRALVQRRYNSVGEFPVLIRGDRDARHKDIRKVMDICSGVGLWKINFAAVKERKT